MTKPTAKIKREPKAISDKPIILIILDVLSAFPGGVSPGITLPEKCIYQGNKSDFVRGVGPMPCQIMFIGEAPGQEEDEVGIPFCGRAGRYMDDCFVEAGIERKQVYITNLVKERPPQNRVPTDKEIRIYAPTLIEEIKKVQPKVIVLLGATALKAVLGMSGITKIHGQIFNSQEFNCKIIPIFHPSYVMRSEADPALRTTFVNDLTRIRKFVEGGAISEAKKPTTYCLVNTIEKFDMLMEKLNKAECVDFDLETTSKDPRTGKVICIAFSINECKAAVLPLFVDGRECWNEQSYVMENLRLFFESDVPKCAQAGALIDIPFLRAAGINVKHYDYDTIIMDYLLDENKKLSQRGLKELAWEHTDMGGYDAELEEIKDRLMGVERKEYLKARKEWKEAGEDPDTEPEKPEISFSQIPFDKLWPYAAADADVCGRLRRLFYKKLEKQELIPLLKKIMMPAQMILIGMEKHGVKIALERLDAIRKEYEELAKEIDTQLQSHPDTLRAKQELGLEEVNFASAPQVQKILFDVLKITPTKRSKITGKPSADKEVLEELARFHEIPRLLNQKRGYEHAVKTYGENFKKSITEDGRVHTSYLIYGTETGRLASRKPNLQNISRPGEDERSDISAKIRDIFIAEEGNILIDADASQIEWRLLANYSQDPRMIQEILDKADQHTATATLISGMIGRTVSRQEGKGANYALIYGATGYRLANLFGVEERVGEEIKDAILSKYPGARRFEENMKILARTNGYVKNTFGRRRRLPGIISDDKKIRGHAERSAINSPIQGLAGDVIYAVMIRLQKIWDENPDVHMIMQVHDSLVHECPKERANFAIANIYREMTRPLPGITIPLEAEIKVGDSLGSLKKLTSEQVQEIVQAQK